MELSPRQEQVRHCIEIHPAWTVREIAIEVGISYQRVHQISVKLQEIGAIDSRLAIRLAAVEREKEAQKEAKEHRKTIWRKMLFIGQRQVYRHMARIDQFGIVRDYHMPGEEAICQFKGCLRSVRARGYCASHYALLRYTGSLWVRRRARARCKEEKCFRPVYARELCNACYERLRRHHPNETNQLLSSSNTSGYRGVSWRKKDRCWCATIHPKGVMIYLGDFKSKEMAARAYDTAARRYFGPEAKLNFPDEQQEVFKHRQRVAEKSSGVPGVHWDKSRSMWRVRITRHGKMIFVGSFVTMDDAIRAREITLSKTAIAENSSRE